MSDNGGASHVPQVLFACAAGFLCCVALSACAPKVSVSEMQCRSENAALRARLESWQQRYAEIRAQKLEVERARDEANAAKLELAQLLSEAEVADKAELIVQIRGLRSQLSEQADAHRNRVVELEAAQAREIERLNQENAETVRGLEREVAAAEARGSLSGQRRILSAIEVVGTPSRRKAILLYHYFYEFTVKVGERIVYRGTWETEELERPVRESIRSNRLDQYLLRESPHD